MTDHNHSTLSKDLLQLLTENRLDCLPELLRVLLNAAMRAERQQFLQAEPFERTPERQAHANGFKD